MVRQKAWNSVDESALPMRVLTLAGRFALREAERMRANMAGWEWRRNRILQKINLERRIAPAFRKDIGVKGD